MNGQPIVVGVNGTAGAVRAAAWGADEAVHRHAPLLLVHAFGVPDAFYGDTAPPREWLAAKEAQSRDWLAEARDVVTGAHPALDVATGSFLDAPVPLLLERSSAARMVVLGSAQRSLLGDLVLGATAGTLAAHARCPVAVVRGREPRLDEPVVAGIDGSTHSGSAVGLAFEEASLRRVQLVALHAEPAMERTAEAASGAVAAWRKKYPEVAVQQVVVREDPRKPLLEWSERAQLVVVGSRGRGGFTGMLLGSTSQAMIHHAACPVLVARSAPGK
ncbi:universal stress protein [Amycolatopsis taiwanensis]|uniref:universal stress protein n=1 Tax=Amycolatopsis taiwanensis TaxID=342230 RepID=UPI0004874839|nr:universal stress protein [Amycolatopsis taiwanensis]